MPSENPDTPQEPQDKPKKKGRESPNTGFNTESVMHLLTKPGRDEWGKNRKNNEE